jgi:hypothetical protein
MPAEPKLEPGWFIKDVRRASERVSQWTNSRNRPASVAKESAGERKAEPQQDRKGGESGRNFK